MANNILIASDNFASGSLAAGWTALGGNVTSQVISGPPNYTEPTAASTQTGQIWTGTAFPTDQCSEVTTTLVNAGTTQVQLYTRLTNGGGTFSGYDLHVQYNGGTTAVLLFRIDSGSVGATLINITSGLTFSTKDVWALQSAGAVHSVYQNNTFIGDATDTTYTTGSPGFGQYSSAAIADTKVYAWRGYNAVQQDGIWQKQGIVMPLTAASIASGGYGLQQPLIIYDNNAQILSPVGGYLYKCWYTPGGPSTGCTNYSESLDGISWTQYVSNPVIAGYGLGVVIKLGTTYHQYVQAAASFGTGNVAHYTSIDGLSWSQVSSNVLAKGTSGQWDAGGIYVSSIIQVGSTIYLYYIGISVAAGSSGPFNAGLATSTDGGSTFTKSASNPILGNASPIALAKVGSILYGWFATGPTSPLYFGNFNYWDPTGCTRYQTTDFIHWTNRTPSIHNSQMFEALNSHTGTCVPYSILNVGGKAYLWLTAGPRDSTAPQDYQTELAIAPVSITELVTQPEDAAQYVATDSFTSGNGDLSANWTTPTGKTKLQIVSTDIVEATTVGTQNAMCYTGASFSNDQFSEITLAALSTNGYVFPMVRTQTGADTFYLAYVTGVTGSLGTVNCAIQVRVAGTSAQIGPAVNITPEVGDVYRLSAIGNVLSFFQNGNLLLQVEDINNTIASGYPGMGVIVTSGALTQAQLSEWAGGNANVLPYSILGSTVPSTLISYTGTASGSVTADVNGNWNLGVLGSGSYTITPSLAGYTFSPSSASETYTSNTPIIVGFNATTTSSLKSENLGLGIAGETRHK